MSERIAEGSIQTGKVTGIQPYGAFVALDDNTQGLVHISEIAHGFVKDIHEYLKIGDEVTVKILSVDEQTGKIGLSIRAVQEPPKQNKEFKGKKPRRRQAVVSQNQGGQQGFNTLKDKLQEWIAQYQR